MTRRADPRHAHGAAGVELRLVDLLLLVGTIPVLGVALGQPINENVLLLETSSILVFIGLAQAARLYAPPHARSLGADIRRLSMVWAMMFAILVIAAFSFKVSARYSRLLVGSWALVAPGCMAAWRVLLRWSMRREALRGGKLRIAAFVGAGSIARRMAEHLSASSWMGLRIAGVYDDRDLQRLSLEKLPLLGNTADLLRDAREGRLDHVYVTLPMHAQKRIVEIVNALADTTASVYVVPDAFLFEMMQATWAEVAGHPVISVYDTPFFGVDGTFKRLEDVVLGALILLLILPLMLGIALGIKLTSRGPVLFRQRRYGLNGNIVEIWKFRTMTVTEDGDHVVQATRGDLRVTRFGAFLRRHSLDELPQFFNVLQGRMSIVGPRPHAVVHNEQYRRLIHGYMLRHKVRPGITGWAQVNGWRGETDTVEKMRKRVEFDLYYMRNWSFLLDLRIIVMTIFKGFRSKNAY